MGRYVTNTREEQQEMLRAIGYESFDDLYRDVPEQMQIHGELKIPCGVSELEVQRRICLLYTSKILQQRSPQGGSEVCPSAGCVISGIAPVGI